MSEARKIKTDETQSAGRGRPRDAEKNAAIVAAAGCLFMEKGFDGTSMDGVARKAGVSKQTVYSHFSNKEQLYCAAISAVIEQYHPEDAVERVETHSLEADLRAVAEAYAHLLLCDEAMAMFRLLVESAPKGPEMAKLFWKAGPSVMQERLHTFLQSWVEKGELDIPDMELAGSLLVSLLKGKAHFLHSIGLLEEITEEQIQTNVDNAVSAFLKLYRV